MGPEQPLKGHTINVFEAVTCNLCLLISVISLSAPFFGSLDCFLIKTIYKAQSKVKSFPRAQFELKRL